MRIFFASLAMLAGLDGCQRASGVVGGEPANQQDVTTNAANDEEATAAEQAPATPLFLSCKGAVNDGIRPPRPETKLLSIPVSTDHGEHLARYVPSEKLYREVCPTAVFTCLTEIDEAIIRERGVQVGNTTGPWMSVTINRRTGGITQQDFSGTTLLSSFEGTCAPADPPAEEPAKF